jgi:hypothetical protein
VVGGLRGKPQLKPVTIKYCILSFLFSYLKNNILLDKALLKKMAG